MTSASTRTRSVPVSVPCVTDAGAYALRCTHDQLAPSIKPGEQALVSPVAPLVVGKLVAVWREGTPSLWILCSRPHVPAGTPSVPHDTVVTEVMLSLLNPPKRMLVEMSKIEKLHAVTGVYALEGEGVA